MVSTDRAAAAPDPRIPWVDYAKGICIILVVMMHSTLGVGDAMGATGFMHAVVAFARPFRVPDFFLISGLFLALVIDRPWRKYIDRKVLHFAYFYLLWLIIQGGFKWPPLALQEGPWAVVEQFLLALIEPFGTLWFIYLLPIFFVTAKLVKNMSPWIVLAVAALLEIIYVDTGWTVIDEFAGRFIYFCIGWYAAPYIFQFAKIVQHRAGAALAALAIWAVLHGCAVFWLDIPTLPVVSLALGLTGCGAVIATAALLARFGLAGFIRYAGEHSIAIYLAFFLPMAATRIALVKTGLVPDVGLVSLIVTAVAVTAPLVLYWFTERTGWGRFLFVRPAIFSIDSPKTRLQPAE